MDQTHARAASALASPRSIDAMMLQTAASLENAAADFYSAAFALPFLRTANPTASAATGSAAGAPAAATVTVIAAFLTRAAGHHHAHARSFNQAAARTGAAAQTAADPRYAKVVADAWPAMTSTAAVVSLALTLEDTAVQTLVKFAGLVVDPATRRLFGSVAPVDAQHRATLLVMQALLEHGANDLIGAPPKAAALPTFVGSVGLPAAIYPASDASAINEGIVR